MSTNELESKCRELRQLHALIEEATAEAERFTRITTTRRFCVA